MLYLIGQATVAQNFDIADNVHTRSTALNKLANCILARLVTIDDLLVNDKRQLLEAKFYQKPVGCREVDPDERVKAAQAFNCDELLLVSLNGFKDDIRLWANSVSLPVRFIEWNEIREDVLESFEGTFTVLLDQVLLEETIATSFSNRNYSGLNF